MTDREPHLVIPNAPHQKLIDGLTALVLKELMEQDEARTIIASYRDLPDSVDGAALQSIYEDYGLNEKGEEQDG